MSVNILESVGGRNLINQPTLCHDDFRTARVKVYFKGSAGTDLWNDPDVRNGRVAVN